MDVHTFITCILLRNFWEKQSKSKFTPRPRDIKILARFYKKYVAKQEYFANDLNARLL